MLLEINTNLRIWLYLLKTTRYEKCRFYLRQTDNSLSTMGMLFECFRIVTGEGRWEKESGFSRGYSFIPRNEKRMLYFYYKGIYEWLYPTNSDVDKAAVKSVIKLANKLNDETELRLKEIAQELDWYIRTGNSVNVEDMKINVV